MPPRSKVAKKKNQKKNVIEIDNDSLPSVDDGSVSLTPTKVESAKTPKTFLSPDESMVKTPSKQDLDSGGAENDTFDLIVPSLIGSGAGDCTVMLQVDPEDAALLDYEGIAGAIGRFEADDNGVVLDLKGCQYQGSILPGPTCLVAGLSKGKQLRVEGITDEFLTFVKTQDIMAKLDAVVKGEMDDGFQIQDDNVNRKNPASTIEQTEKKKASSKQSNTASSSSAKKRGRRSTSSTTPTKSGSKKRKV